MRAVLAVQFLDPRDTAMSFQLWNRLGNHETPPAHCSPSRSIRTACSPAGPACAAAPARASAASVAAPGPGSGHSLRRPAVAVAPTAAGSPAGGWMPWLWRTADPSGSGGLRLPLSVPRFGQSVHDPARGARSAEGSQQHRDQREAHDAGQGKQRGGGRHEISGFLSTLKEIERPLVAVVTNRRKLAGWILPLTSAPAPSSVGPRGRAPGTTPTASRGCSCPGPLGPGAAPGCVHCWWRGR